MRDTRHLFVVILSGLVLTAAGASGDIVVPLPPPGVMVVSAHTAFAEVLLNITNENNPLNLPAGFCSHVAVGFTRDADGNGTSGDNAFVLYTGALATVGSAPTPPGKILAIDPTGAAIKALFTGTGEWAGISRGELYVGGMIQTLRTQGLAVPGFPSLVSYNLGGSDTNPNPQLTFAVYNARVTNMGLNATDDGSQGGFMKTTFQITGSEGVHLDVYADATPDARRDAPPSGRRYTSVTGALVSDPQLPLRDDGAGATLLCNPRDGTYYDRAGGGWGGMDWAGNPADDDKVMWSFVGNPQSQFVVNESFNTSPTGETFPMTWAGPDGIAGNADDVTTIVHAAGSSELNTQIIIEGQFRPGKSLAPGDKLTADGLGFLNVNLAGGYDYHLSGEFLFGGSRTGSYDSDPRTWSFHQDPTGAYTLTQLSGLLVPEPTTLVLLMAGAAFLLLRRNRRRTLPRA